MNAEGGETSNPHAPALSPREKEAEPRAAYIHVPFCRHRCGYCNFTLVAGRDDLVTPFLTVLERELSWLGQPREVETLFFGGGTPTHLRGEQLRKLLETVAKWHPLAAREAKDYARPAEFSVEANPADIDEKTVAILADYGVTRISLEARNRSMRPNCDC